MQEQKYDERSGMLVTFSGLAMLGAVLLVQFAAVSSLSEDGAIILSAEQSSAFVSAAFPTFGIVVAALGMSMVGIVQLLDSWRSLEDKKGIVQSAKRSIARALVERRRVFWISLPLYLALFMFLSGSLVFSSEQISERYSTSVPSYHVIGCCGQPGSFPVLTVYLTEHAGLLLVPTNIILLCYLPFLVAINAALIADKLAARGKGRRIGNNMSFCGISAGVLAGCPTCAGSVILSLVGGGYAAGIAAAAVAGYQPVLAVGSIAALIVAPLIMELGATR